MRLGILADIHEQVEPLRQAVKVLRQQGAERFVVLGDVFETGPRMQETVALLRETAAVGVWGNHDAGFCLGPTEAIRRRFGPEVSTFMEGLQPRLEIDGCSFSHVEPWLNPHLVEDLWYYDGLPDSPSRLARSFAATSSQIILVGHYHRWLHGTPEGPSLWKGEAPLRLDSGRHYVAVHAVADGHCALLDTGSKELTPMRLG